MKLVSILAIGFWFLVATTNCKGKESSPEKKHEPPPTTEPKLHVTETPDDIDIAWPDGIAWIENDYETAIALAREQGKPLVLSFWAAWSHMCLSTREYTLKDQDLATIANDFVWLSIDTEDLSSAGVMVRFPPKFWPTVFVINPTDESVLASQIGPVSVLAFKVFLERGTHPLSNEDGSGGALKDSALGLLRSGDRAWMHGQYQEAATHYARARKAGGDGWKHASSAIKNELFALQKLEDKSACAEFAATQIDFMATHHSPVGFSFLHYASTCASALPEAGRDALLSRIVDALQTIARDEKASLNHDGRSTALSTARHLASKLKNTELAKSLAVEQQTLLANAVGKATSPLGEMIHLWHLVQVHADLEQGEAILPWVEALETKLPGEFEPPFRRGWLLLRLKRYKEAHAAIAKALPLALGARRGRILGLDAAIYKAEGNLEREHETRLAIVSHFKDLEVGLSSPRMLSKAEKALAAMAGQ